MPTWKPRLPVGAIKPTGKDVKWYQVCVDPECPSDKVYVQLPRVYMSTLAWAKLLAGRKQGGSIQPVSP